MANQVVETTWVFSREVDTFAPLAQYHLRSSFPGAIQSDVLLGEQEILSSSPAPHV
jgi:hypothetical protein